MNPRPHRDLVLVNAAGFLRSFGVGLMGVVLEIYVWGWALVNAANRGAAFSKVPEPGLLGGVVPVAFNGIAMLTGYISPDEHFVTCPNQDVVYGFAFGDLDKEPIVFQVTPPDAM